MKKNQINDSWQQSQLNIERWTNSPSKNSCSNHFAKVSSWTSTVHHQIRDYQRTELKVLQAVLNSIVEIWINTEEQLLSLVPTSEQNSTDVQITHPVTTHKQKAETLGQSEIQSYSSSDSQDKANPTHTRWKIVCQHYNKPRLLQHTCTLKASKEVNNSAKEHFSGDFILKVSLGKCTIIQHCTLFPWLATHLKKWCVIYLLLQRHIY